MIKLEQKKFYYQFSALTEPTLKIKPGETITTSFPDFVEGVLQKDGDRLPFELSEAHWNPLAGPIYVEGAEKGDTLKVEIKDIIIDSDQGVGILIPPFDDVANALLKPPDYKIKICPIKSGKVSFKDGIEVPLTPLIGCIGTAPLHGSIPAELAGPYGGNMDVPEIRKGTIVYLPVFVKGGLLSIGDAHAWQPAGELCACDAPATATFTVNLLKNKKINWPRYETGEYLMSINTVSPFEKAVQVGIGDMIGWLGEYGLDAWDAWEKIAEVCEFQIGKFSPPVFNTKFPKKYLPPYK